jgi:hypothetical protein
MRRARSVTHYTVAPPEFCSQALTCYRASSIHASDKEAKIASVGWIARMTEPRSGAEEELRRTSTHRS